MYLAESYGVSAGIKGPQQAVNKSRGHQNDEICDHGISKQKISDKLSLKLGVEKFEENKFEIENQQTMVYVSRNNSDFKTQHLNQESYYSFIIDFTQLFQKQIFLKSKITDQKQKKQANKSCEKDDWDYIFLSTSIVYQCSNQFAFIQLQRYMIGIMSLKQEISQNVCEKTANLKSYQTATCQNYYLGMESTWLCTPSNTQTKRASSLPNKIKIRTCKLPKDFFQAHTAHLLKTKSGCESRGSTCDEEASHPSTPSFKECRQTKDYLQLSRKAQTARIIPDERSYHGGLVRERSQSIKRKLSKEVSQRFPLLLLPPISISARVFVGL